MTTLGQLLVFLNLLMSGLFVWFSLLVFQARVDLKKKWDNEKSRVQEMDTKRQEAETQNGDLQNKLATAEKGLEAKTSELKTQQIQAQGLLKQVTDARDKLQKEQVAIVARLDAATTEVKQRGQEVEQLRQHRSELVKTNTDFVDANSALKDQVAQLKAQLDSVNQRLQQTVQSYSELTRYVQRSRNGVLPTSDEIKSAEGEVPPPPDVPGIVTRVDNTQRFIQISLGEDDGIHKGQVLQIWRTTPEPKYLGEIKIFQAEATTSVAKPVSLVGTIQENDKVGARIFPTR